MWENPTNFQVPHQTLAQGGALPDGYCTKFECLEAVVISASEREHRGWLVTAGPEELDGRVQVLCFSRSGSSGALNIDKSFGARWP